MIYDAIVIGAGVAGLTCAMKLKQLGKSCIILEKRSLTTAKACGGGITNNALSLLSTLGIHTNEFLNADAKIITKVNQSFPDGTTEIYYYKNSNTKIKHSVGIRRKKFDEILLSHAAKNKIRIITGFDTNQIINNNYIHINDYIGRNLIYATGSMQQYYPSTYLKTFGISTELKAEMNVSDNTFYFFIDKSYYGGYAWIFPNGTNCWNIGVWQRNHFKLLKENFKKFYTTILTEKITHFTSIELPKSGSIHCGNKEIYIKYNNVYYIGECIGFASEQNGEGIYQAILSGISAAMDLYNTQ